MYLIKYLSVLSAVNGFSGEQSNVENVQKKDAGWGEIVYGLFAPNVFLTHALVFSMSSLNRFSSSGVLFGGTGFSAGVA